MTRLFACLATTALIWSAAIAQAPASSISPQFATWTDPTEHAFTVKAPIGWNIKGGTHRNSPIDARNYVDAQSTDGKVRVWIDAPTILPRQEPHPAYYQLGWYQGRVVQSPAGPLYIASFESGATFARGETALYVCQRPQALSSFDLAAESRAMTSSIASAAARAGVHATASAGEFVYHCADRSGYTYAVTVLAFTTPQGPHSWAVYKVGGYLADKSEVDVARYVLDQMRTSFQIDPTWQANYERQIHDTTGALMEISNRLTQDSIQEAQQSLARNTAAVEAHQRAFDQSTAATSSAFARQQQSEDSIRQRWSDITLGQIHGCDDLGNCGEVSNDYDYYWTKDGKTVVGGASDGSPPGPEYHAWKPDY